MYLAANRCESTCEKARNPWCLWQTGPLAISSSGCLELITVSAVINSRFISMNSYFVTIGGRRRWRRSKRCSDLELGTNLLSMRR